MPPKSKFYWYDAEKDAFLVDTLLEEEDLEYAMGFYDDRESAFDAIERYGKRLEDETELYGVVLKKTGNMTVAEATDALTDQAGFDDFTD